MNAEIIAIGSELTSGAKLDTNSQWLSLRLAEIGISCLYHTTIADDLNANVEALKIAVSRADLICITGGLGPTLDDLTRHAMAGLMDVDLVEHAESMQHLESFFQSRGREMPERNRIQAMFPMGSEPIVNPVGTAPGIWAEVPRDDQPNCFIAAFPGVPSEMKKMFLEQVRPRLPGGETVIRRARINCFGLGESAVEEILGTLTERGSDPEVGITAHEATITLRINAHGTTENECLKKIESVESVIRDRLGDFVFGVEDEELEDAVIRLLLKSDLTFATVEHATAGLLAQRIAHVVDAAECYRGGAVAVISEDSLKQEAESIRSRTNADFVIAIGSEAVTTDGTGRMSSKIPLLLLGPDLERSEIMEWSGNPAITKSKAAKTAIDALRRHLMQSVR
ncbi:CinA family nicotinamide mononucleotide deamidase-related protein [Thalassoglobus sp. JC818]|uniref:CinA family nicotinamide mononucleotide deamidase-related protein n=1 Tax=Thalassoglobus sp. JC818 TaxID=3232136 RepID=UPI00345A8B93